MKFIPTLCVDDFYSDPKRIRDFALSLDYNKLPGNYPGERTENLYKINKSFFDSFCSRLFSILFDYDFTRVEWAVSTHFQKIYPHNKEKKSFLNTGWQHIDIDYAAAGVIYLNEISDLDSGTSFYRLKKSNTLEKLDYTSRDILYSDKEIDYDEYIKSIKKHDSKFEKTLEVKNVFNRMIMYQSDIFHKESNFYANDFEPRLTQVFFIHHLTCEKESIPIYRKNNYEIEF